MAQDRRAWFGPHRIGFGWGPRAWQGWVILGVALLLAIAAARLIWGG